jgi:hypothetical protein
MMSCTCDVAAYARDHIVRDVKIGLPELGKLLLKIQQAGEVPVR